MILVLGGIASGKRTYLRSLGYTDDKVGCAIASLEPALYGLEECLTSGDLSQDELEALVRKDVVACCEVGQGVVAMDARDRVWQERVGRTCCWLAQRASKVVRMVCGIPTVIKE
jgi:adenosyl cobinamide kinase/adenosyl cobinamide phosphate guanylyltransferase